MKKEVRISQKVVLSSSIIIIILNLVIGLILAQLAKNDSIQQFKQSGNEVLSAIATDLNVEALIQVLEEKDEESENFKEIHSYLNKMIDATSLTYIYTTVYEDNGNNVYYLVDGQDMNSDERCKLGEKDEVDSNSFTQLIKGEKVVSQLYNTEEWGELLTIEIPVYSKQNDLVIALAGDFKAADVLNEAKAFRNRMLVTLFLISVIELIFVGTYIRRLLGNSFK